jgi:hypothetical protein
LPPCPTIFIPFCFRKMFIMLLLLFVLPTVLPGDNAHISRAAADRDLDLIRSAIEVGRLVGVFAGHAEARVHRRFAQPRRSVDAGCEMAWNAYNHVACPAVGLEDAFACEASLPISTVTLPAPVWAFTPRSAALSGSTTSILPPPVPAERRLTAMPDRSSLRLPPSLWRLCQTRHWG